LLTRHDAANNKPNIFMFPSVRTLRPDITLAFDQVIMKALAPNIEQRWASADDMDRALINLPPVTAVPTLVAPPRLAAQGVSLTPHLPMPGSGQSAPQYSSPNISGMPATHSTTGPAGAQLNAAMAHIAAGRIEAAYDAVKMAHGFEPNNSLVHKLFGQVYARRRPPQIDTAIMAYNRSLQLNADDAETHKLLGDVWLYLRPNYTQAAQEYIQSLRLNQNDFEAHERLAECYDKSNRPELAVREYQEAIRLAPAEPTLLRLRLNFALGQVAMRVYQWPVAEQAFVQVLILNASDNQARFLLSQVYEHEGKLDEAFRECNFVMGSPLAATNPAVSPMYYRLKTRLGR
jgi:tetratricopeptide (TPR) repeat protein